MTRPRPSPSSARARRRPTRSQRRAAERRRSMRITAAVALAVLFGGAVAVAVAAFVAGSGSSAESAHKSRAAATKATVPTTPVSTTALRSCRAPLTADEPLRLWIAGDSLAYSVGNGLGKPAAATGVVAPVYESRVSSGLSSPGFFDWPKRVAEELPSLDPEVVVFVMGTNDWQVPQATPVDAAGQPAWKGQYAAQVQAMVDLLTRDGRTLYWLGPPVLRETQEEVGAKQVASVIQSVVQRNPNAEFVDMHALTEADDGSYSPTVEVNGKKVTIRTGDGVHLTTDGAEYIGNAVFARIDARCRLKAQSVPNSKQVVVETKGSTSVPQNSTATAPPVSRPAGTTPAATAPPTSPPTTAPAAPAPTSPPATAPPATSPPTTAAPPTPTTSKPSSPN